MGFFTVGSRSSWAAASLLLLTLLAPVRGDEVRPDAVFAGHVGVVYAAAFSPDGRTLASGCSDRTVKLWDVDSHQVRATLKGHSSDVIALSFAPDGKTLASGSIDGAVKLWDDVRPRELRTIDTKGQLKQVAFVDEGRSLAAASVDYDGLHAWLWDPFTGQQRQDRIFKGQDWREIFGLAFSPDSVGMAVAVRQVSDQGVLTLYDLREAKQRDQLGGNFNFTCVAYSPRGRYLAAGDRAGVVRLWDAATGRKLVELRTDNDTDISAVCFSPDEGLLAAGSGRDLFVWDIGTGRQRADFQAFANAVRSLSFAPDGSAVAAGTTMNVVDLWKMSGAGAASQATARGPSGGQSLLSPRRGGPRAAGVRRLEKDVPSKLHSVAISPDGRWIAAGAYDRTVPLWDLSTGRLVTTFEGHRDAVGGVAFTPDGKTLLSASGDHTVKLWDIENQHLLDTLGTPDFEESSSDPALALSPDGKRLAVTSQSDQQVRLWDLSARRQMAVLEGPGTPPSSVAFSPDGRLLAVGYAQGENVGEVKVFDLDQHKEQATLDGPRLAVFSPDGKTLAAIEHADVELWDPSTGQRRTVLGHHRYHTSCIAFAPDGKTLASGGIDGVAKLWDLQSGKQQAEYPGQFSEDVAALTFALDGKALAVVRDTAISVYDLTSPASGQGRAMAQGAAPQPPGPRQGPPPSPPQVISRRRPPNAGRQRAVYQAQAEPQQAAAPSNDPNDQPAKGQDEGRMRIYEPQPEPAANPALKGNRSEVQLLAFSREGKLAATAAMDGTITIFNAASTKELASIPAHMGAILAIGFADDAKTLTSVGQDQSAKVWDVANGKQVAMYKPQQPQPNPGVPQFPIFISQAACLPDGKTIAFAADQIENMMAVPTVTVLDVRAGKALASFKGQANNSIGALATSADGKLLAAGYRDGTVRTWQWPAAKESAALKGDAGGIDHLAISPDARHLAASDDKRQMLLWDLTHPDACAKVPPLQETITSLSFSPDGKTLAIAHGRQIDLWDSAGQRQVGSIKTPTDMTAMAYAPDASALAYATRGENDVTLYPVASVQQQVLVLSGHTQPVLDVCFSPDGALLASAGHDDTVRLWELPGGKEQRTLGHQDVGSVSFAPDGKTLASGATMNDLTVKLWDVAAGRELPAVEGGGPLAFSPDGRVLASDSREGLNLWDAATRQRIASVRRPYMLRGHLDFTADSRQLAFLSEGEVHIVDPASGRELRVISAKPEAREGRNRGGAALSCFAMGPDGTVAGYGNPGTRDVRIAVWDPSGRQRDAWRLNSDPNAWDAPQSLRLSPDGRILAVGYQNSVRLLSAANGRELARFEDLNSPAFAFSADGRMLAIGVTDGTIHVYRVPDVPGAPSPSQSK